MDNHDALAAATLAASRCAALGQHDINQYFEQYVQFENLFNMYRAEQSRAKADAFMDGWKKLAE